jgi:hypothetical protein
MSTLSVGHADRGGDLKTTTPPAFADEGIRAST